MYHSRLFKPLKIGNIEVKHRIGMAPLTRYRATDDRVPTPMMKDYYTQRASVPGTLIIAEATFVSPNIGGCENAPGIWNEDQVAAWREITDDVHRKGSFIFCQLGLLGRTADADMSRNKGIPFVAPSAIPMDENAAVPRAMTVEEIKQTVREFGDASEKAMRAGFDGVEIHGALGYLLDQFLQDVSNQRHDKYGGSVENRSRFLDEVIRTVVETVGPERVGLRLSPWSTFQGMRMEDPIPQFTHVIGKARESKIAYLHLVESRLDEAGVDTGNDSLDFAFRLWDKPLLIAGGYTPQHALELVDEKIPNHEVMAMFGRLFVSNPDLVYRISKNLDLAAYDRGTFYSPKIATGYSDYAFSKEYLESAAA